MRKEKDKIIRLIIINVLLTFALFISFPIENLYFLDRFNLSAESIGFISGIVAITILCFSLFIGTFTTFYGYLKSMKLGILFIVFAFLIMGFAKSIQEYCIGLLLIGMGKAAFDNAIKLSIVKLSSKEEIEKYFRLRYLLQNVGAGIGSFLSIYIYKSTFNYTFIITSLLLFLTFVILIGFTYKKDVYKSKEKEEKKVDVKKSKQNLLENILILKDRKLLMWIFSGLFVIIAYGAYEEMTPIITADSSISRPSFGLLLAINSIVVIVAQVFIFAKQSFFKNFVKRLNNLKLKTASNLGFLFLAVGFMFLSVEFFSYVMTITGVILFSIGESILFPCFDISMEKIAPKEKSASYYGVGEIKSIGFFIGPVLGGIILGKINQSTLFIFCALCIIISMIIFNLLEK